MGRNLPHISSEPRLDYFRFCQQELAETLAEGVADDASPEERAHHAWFAGDYSFDVGAWLYQQGGDIGAIRAHFSRAAEFLVTMHELMGPPEPAESRNVWDFIKTIDLVVCSGTPALRQRLAPIEELAYQHPIDPETEAPVAYAEVLKRYVAGLAVARDQVRALEARCTASQDLVEWREELLLDVRGLSALLDRDAAALQGVVTALLTLHEHEARNTEFGELGDSFLCLPALSLVQLGREAGVPCEIESPYLPLELLDESPIPSSTT